LDSEFEQRQFSESHAMKRVSLFWPQIQGITVDELAKLREDEFDAFSRLHYSLRTFLRNIPKSQSDSEAIELAKLVDFEAKSFESRMKTLRKKHALSLGEMFVGTSAVIACLSIPEVVAQILSGVIGVSQVKSGLQRGLDSKTKNWEHNESPFYIAWRLHRGL